MENSSWCKSVLLYVEKLFSLFILREYKKIYVLDYFSHLSFILVLCPSHYSIFSLFLEFLYIYEWFVENIRKNSPKCVLNATFTHLRFCSFLQWFILSWTWNWCFSIVSIATDGPEMLVYINLWPNC